MIKSILKKVLVFILASSSIILLFVNQDCLAMPNDDKVLRFSFRNDKHILIEAYNNMLATNESPELYKAEEDDFTFLDYALLKDFILNTDDYDKEEKEIVILACVRSKAITLDSRNHRAEHVVRDMGFKSYEDKFLFLDAYNVMCFYKGEEKNALFLTDQVFSEDLIKLKDFYSDNITFYSVEKVNKILEMIDNTINYNNSFDDDFFTKYKFILDPSDDYSSDSLLSDS